MYDRLLTIDELTRPDHSDLDPDDACYYMGEYTARGGFAASDTNDLIVNLKKPMDRRGRPEWRYKAGAIRAIATDLRRLLGRSNIEKFTFVPVPPSKARDDPGYDDRLADILGLMGQDYAADIRELIIQRESAAADHERDRRATIAELMENYCVDEEIADPPPERVLIFDDMLTNGRHFKAVRGVLAERFPAARFTGLFVARRAPDSQDLGDFL